MEPQRSRRARIWLTSVLMLITLGACDWTKPKVPDAEQRGAQRKQADARRLRQACGSAETYDRLKAFVFDEANRLKAGRTAMLDRVEANTTVRMEDPVAVSRDEQLDVTVCRGRLVLDLPPGVEDAFNGARQLKAEVEYAAQAAADGSGLVYQMKAAEPIIYRLATLTLPAAGTDTAVASTSVPAPASPETPPAAASTDTAVASIASPPRPAPRPEPASPPRPASRPEPAPPPRARPPRDDPPAPRVEEPAPLPASRERAEAPSFSCARVTGRVLRTICGDASLSALDRRMSSSFYAALADSDPGTRATLRASRDRFLRYRDRCPTSACIAQTYQDRMAEIRDIAGR